MSDYIQSSLLYCLLKKLSVYYKNSLLWSIFKEVPLMFSNSLINRTFRSFTRKKSTVKNSYVYIVLQRFLRAISISINSDKMKPRWLKAIVIQNNNAISKFSADIINLILAGYLFLDLGIRIIIGNYLVSKYWDEVLLVFCLFLLLYRCLILISKSTACDTLGLMSPLHFPIIFYAAVCSILFIFKSPDLLLALEGLSLDVQYILWFFVAVSIFRNLDSVKKVYYIMALSGLVLAIHGVYQYIIGIDIPSNWIDMAEVGVRTRVFSIVGSPNILGSLMVIFIPITISLLFFEKNFIFKISLGISIVIMTACLIFTFSRGAWISFTIALIVLAIIKEKKIFIILFAGIFLTCILVPSFVDRIVYLFSPEYIESSLRGGRLMRLEATLQVMSENLWFGQGFGRFGGAVAANHRDILPNTFYTDNYYLKIIGEIGLVGFMSFILLLYNVVVCCIRGIVRIGNNRYNNLMYGGVAALFGVMIHNIFENVFEVPAMVIYFWLITACVIYLGFGSGEKYYENSNA